MMLLVIKICFDNLELIVSFSLQQIQLEWLITIINHPRSHKNQYQDTTYKHGNQNKKNKNTMLFKF